MKFLTLVLPLLLVTSANALAMPKKGCGGECSSCHSLTVKEANTILKGMGEVKQVKTPAVRGLWELDFEKDGKRAIAYMDYGKKYLIPGPVFSIATRTPIAEAATPPAPPAKVKSSSIPLANSVIMGNPAAKKKLFVFTDPDCPYCARLHDELKKLVAMDKKVAVYVKLFPLKMHPNAYDRARAILSGGDPNKLLDEAFIGARLPAPAPNAGKGVDANLKLGRSLGVNATPTLVFPDGRVMPGYREAGEIRKLLAGKKK